MLHLKYIYQNNKEHNDQKMSEERIWLHVRVVDETAVAKEMRECSKIQTAYIPSVNRT